MKILDNNVTREMTEEEIKQFLSDMDSFINSEEATEKDYISALEKLGVYAYA